MLEKNNKIIFLWIPGHKNIEGNEVADQAADEGYENCVYLLTPLPDSYIIKKAQETLKKNFQKWYEDKANILGQYIS